MWGSVSSLPARLLISTVAGMCPRLRWETVPVCLAHPCRLLTQSCLECQPFPVLDRSGASLRSSRWSRLFPGSAMVADTVAAHLLQAGPPESGPLVLECNPGPGMITSALLNAGLQVIALESDQIFLPYLKSLKNHLNGQLEVIYCDFFNRDPSDDKATPPVMFTETLFKDFGIRKIPWASDVPVKIVGFFPAKHERRVLWKLLFDLYSRCSIYDYGRVELNMFISEKEYKKIISKPGEKFYQPLSVLCQIAYEIKLLHMEPLSSFVTFKNGKFQSFNTMESKNNHLNFIRLTPRKNLFTDTLTPMNSYNFIYLVKQCFAKRKHKLINLFNSWCVHDAVDLLQQLNRNNHELVDSLGPEEFKYLFEALENSETFSQKWLFDNFLQTQYLEST